MHAPINIPHHNIGFGGKDYFDIAFDKVRGSLDGNRVTLYCLEPMADDEARAGVIDRMESHGIENVQRHIDAGLLALIDNESTYADAGLNPQTLKNNWLSLFADMKRRNKGRRKGVTALYSAEPYVNADHFDSFLAWEIMTGKKFGEPAELFCWYKKQWLENLSFVHLVHLFTCHYSSVHQKWRYKRWSSKDLAELITRGMGRVLGDKPALALIETMRIRYRLPRGEIAAKPEYFETILNRMLSSDSEAVLNSIAGVLKESIQWENKKSEAGR